LYCSASSVIRCYRLGRFKSSTSMCRPIRVELSSAEERDKVLQAKHIILAKEKSEPIFIDPDRSRSERIKFKQYRDKKKKN